MMTPRQRARRAAGIAVLVAVTVFAVWFTATVPAHADPTPAPGGGAEMPHAPAPGPKPSARPESRPAPDKPSHSPSKKPSATPSPGLTPPPVDPSTGKPPAQDGGGLFDLPGMLRDAITAFLTDLISEAQKPLLKALADTALSTPRVTGNPVLVKVWTGSLALAGSAYVLLIVAGAVLVMGHGTVQARHSAKEIAPRLAMGMIASALSLTVMDKAIVLANGLTAGVMTTGIDSQGLAEQLATAVLHSLAGNTAFLALLNLLFLVLLLGVFLGYLVRIALIALLAGTAPLALACHALPHTNGLAKLWWRALFGALAIQFGQAIVFILGMRLFFARGNTGLLGYKPGSFGQLAAGIALFWMLLRIPTWTAKLVFRATPLAGAGMPMPLRLARTMAIAQIMGPMRAGRARPGAGAGAAPRAGGGGGGRMPGGRRHGVPHRPGRQLRPVPPRGHRPGHPHRPQPGRGIPPRPNAAPPPPIPARPRRAPGVPFGPVPPPPATPPRPPGPPPAPPAPRRQPPAPRRRHRPPRRPGP